MKFGLIIQDLTKDEVGQVLGKLSPLNITSITELPQDPAPAPAGMSSAETTNAPPIPQAAPIPQSTGEEKHHK